MSATIKGGIGGSDIAAIVGMSPYKSAFDVYARIVEGVDNKSGTRARLGKLAEGEILADFCERHELDPKALERNVEIALPGKPHFRGELDARKSAEFGVECKLVGFRQAPRWGADGSDHLPEEYLCQVAWYSMLAGLPVMHVAAWFDGGGDYREFAYTRNATLEASLVEAADRFWTDHVLKGVAPSAVGASPEAIRAIYPGGNGNVREATEEEITLIDAYARQREAREQCEAHEEELKAKLQAAIADADGLYSSIGKITWKAPKASKKTNWEAIAKACNAPAALISEHTEEKPGSRRFLWTPNKKG
jgi:putative phage-type endonuclease